MPDARAVLRNLSTTLEIQEPAFKEVVILYRCLAPQFDHWRPTPCMPALHTQAGTIDRYLIDAVPAQAQGARQAGAHDRLRAHQAAQSGEHTLQASSS